MLISDASIREIGFQRRTVTILSTNKGITLANMWYDGDVMEDTVGIYLDTLKGPHVATSLEVWLGLGVSISKWPNLSIRERYIIHA